MPRRELPKPSIASWSIWKVMGGALYLWIFFTFLSWLFNSMLHQYNTGVFVHPITVSEILVGSGWVPWFLWSRWNWQSRRKHARWLRWLEAFSGTLYFSILMLLLPIACWNALLKNPWKWVVNGSLIALFMMAWLLPAISYSVAKKLVDMQWRFNMRILSCGGLSGLMVLAGILGASFGMNVSRSGKVGSAILVTAFLSSPMALSVAQMGAETIWRYRPWAKEEE